MYLLISAYSGSRKLGKALTRISNKLESLEKEIKSIDFQNEPYKGVIISFVDEDEKYFEKIIDKDRVYHADVGISPNLTFLPNDDKKFLSYIYEKVDSVIKKCKIEQSDKKKIKDVLLAWNKSL